MFRIVRPKETSQIAVVTESKRAILDVKPAGILGIKRGNI
jgi:hypothetical protein